MGDDVTLVHYGLLSQRSPHSSASQPPLFKEDFTESNCPPDSLTPGEGFVRIPCIIERYNVTNLYRVGRAFPEGEGGPANAGSNEGHLPHLSRSVLR